MASSSVEAFTFLHRVRCSVTPTVGGSSPQVRHPLPRPAESRKRARSD
eukprot:CAMPEP_0113696354 /NCGR_PEP_ID=MMETSP0038_2-20120614/21441_1 /TAXON_ID=2898 /ORGANISM="Cryptomonas paramecium" /LENGTH=47 /DNA_ID=CAMNT_0000619063 /DNA_START=11 /DNA_END=151 /DNA_ORIENTATION=+ /assembly_acc=CAM_ASM_000170